MHLVGMGLGGIRVLIGGKYLAEMRFLIEADDVRWAIGVMLGIYVAGDSGAFLNPAITFSNCLYRQLPWRRFPVYFLAQILGGFVGSGIVYGNYVNAVDLVEGHGVRSVPPAKTATAGIFCTYPQPFMTKTGMFFSEVVASAILVFVLFALKDQSNCGVPKVRFSVPFLHLGTVADICTG